MSTDFLRRGALVAVSVLAAAATVLAPTVARPQAPRVEPRIVATPSPAPTPVPIPSFKPFTVELPTLGERAPVIPVGLDSQGAMDTPKTAHEVAWWEGVPVGAGNALLAGHRNFNGRQGSFGRLGDLKTGDLINVYGEGGYQLGFRVEWIRQMDGDVDATEILNDVGQPVITLITCAGPFNARTRHYEERIVVRAVMA